MFITPKISRERAEDIFVTRKSHFSLNRPLFAGKNPAMPEKMEVLYLPFYLFDVLVSENRNGNKNTQTNQQRVTLSVDGLRGQSVLFATDVPDCETDAEASGSSCDFKISPSYASKIALERYKGILLEHGLRTRSLPSAKQISEGRKIFYPFWIAYYKRKKGYDFKAVDAVSGEIQGVQMRRLLIRALKNLIHRS
ncbi:MAG: hypothetical protein PVH84_17085 [Candidatus Aminicenantes bacterium]|jgi:hypothetical protein